MKTWKLVSGIISIVLFAFVMFQSCAAGISNSLAENGESGGFTMAGSYADLNVWAAWCLICAVFAAVSLKKGQ